MMGNTRPSNTAKIKPQINRNQAAIVVRALKIGGIFPSSFFSLWYHTFADCQEFAAYYSLLIAKLFIDFISRPYAGREFTIFELDG
jgi:hypothetical protein